MNHTNNNINIELRSFLKTRPLFSSFTEWMKSRNLRILLENTTISEKYKADTFFEPVLSNTMNPIVLGGRFL